MIAVFLEVAEPLTLEEANYEISGKYKLDICQKNYAITVFEVKLRQKRIICDFCLFAKKSA